MVVRFASFIGCECLSRHYALGGIPSRGFRIVVEDKASQLSCLDNITIRVVMSNLCVCITCMYVRVY